MAEGHESGAVLGGWRGACARVTCPSVAGMTWLCARLWANAERDARAGERGGRGAHWTGSLHPRATYVGSKPLEIEHWKSLAAESRSVVSCGVGVGMDWEPAGGRVSLG